jgi:hypothetical protein
MDENGKFCRPKTRKGCHDQGKKSVDMSLLTIKLFFSFICNTTPKDNFCQ